LSSICDINDRKLCASGRGMQTKCERCEKSQTSKQKQRDFGLLELHGSSIRFEIGDPPVENRSALRIQLREALPGKDGRTNVAWDSNHFWKAYLKASGEIKRGPQTQASLERDPSDLSSLVPVHRVILRPRPREACICKVGALFDRRDRGLEQRSSYEAERLLHLAVRVRFRGSDIVAVIKSRMGK
jgi:hypothetical protein